MSENQTKYNHGGVLSQTTIRTFSGIMMDVFSPTPEMICIEDIAHSLSNQVKERPILFSTPMVQAISGTKTQTRRTKGLTKVNVRVNDWASPVFDPSTNEWVFTAEHGTPEQIRVKCPYGKVGDVLWVRETWGSAGNRVFYKADNNDTENSGLRGLYDFKWKPSIHMPYVACRLKLEITAIRTERLNDISEDDAKAEGVKNADSFSGIGVNEFMVNRYAYRELWDSINGPGSWDSNPFVWVIEFKKQ